MICFSIQAVHEIWGDAGEKRKKLPLGSNVSSKIDGIFILCKNFRFLRFSFKFAGVDSGRNITNALLHHSRYILFPKNYIELINFVSDQRKMSYYLRLSTASMKIYTTSMEQFGRT